MGHFFQDRFRSETVEEASYVFALARYIHQNPVKADIVKSMDEYEWSSYNCYLNENSCFAKVVDTETILGLFSNDEKIAQKLFEEFINQEAQEEFIH